MSGKVVVTGAGGRTGRLVVKKALEKGYEVVAVVRSQESQAELSASGAAAHVWDVAAGGPSSQLQAAMQGAAALILVTSAVPERLPSQQPGPPVFSWKGGQTPEQVDYQGQLAQFSAAKAAGITHVVVVGSMGGTDERHFLNTMCNGGNILNWKRKAEQALIASGLRYTIVHPGGLLDEPGGQRQLLVGVDDALVKGSNRTVPREDVAEVCVQCLALPQAHNVAFDLASIAPGAEGSQPTRDFGALLDSLGGKSCDYAINNRM